MIFFVEIEVKNKRYRFTFARQKTRNFFMTATDLFKSIKIVRFGQGIWE